MAVALPIGMRSPCYAIGRGASHGFTLLEILVVIALLSLLSTGVAVGVLKALEGAKIKQAEIDAAAFASGAEAFVITHGDQDCPTPEGLSRDGLLSHRSHIEDPWGTPYQIRCETRHAVASSAGPDRIFGNGDDVHSGATGRP